MRTALSVRSLVYIILAGVGCLMFSGQANSHPDPLENIKIYSYILSISEDNAYVYLNRGICYRLVSDFTKALDDFNQAEKLGIKGRPLWMNRAMAYLSLRKFDQAHREMSQIIQDNPRDSTSRFYRGEISFRKGNFKEAIEDYTAGLEVQKSPYLLFVRADAYRTIGDSTHALKDYSEAIALANHMVPFRIARARVYGSCKRYTEARQDLDEAIRLQPERYQVYIEKAVLSASQGLEASRTADLASALKYVEDEIFFRPNDPAVLADRARVFELKGDLGHAVEDLNRAVDSAGPNDPRLLRLRAEFFHRHERIKEATADLTQASVAENRPVPTATPLPGPTLTLEELSLQPTPNLLPELAR